MGGLALGGGVEDSHDERCGFSLGTLLIGTHRTDRCRIGIAWSALGNKKNVTSSAHHRVKSTCSRGEPLKKQRETTRLEEKNYPAESRKRLFLDGSTIWNSWSLEIGVHTPGSTNMAGWKMDSDWVDVFPLEKLWFSSNRYVRTYQSVIPKKKTTTGLFFQPLCTAHNQGQLVTAERWTQVAALNARKFGYNLDLLRSLLGSIGFCLFSWWCGFGFYHDKSPWNSTTIWDNMFLQPPQFSIWFIADIIVNVLMQFTQAFPINACFFYSNSGILGYKPMNTFVPVLMPKFKSKQCRSLSRLGFHEKYTGLPCRPGMLLQTQTMDIVWDYIQKIGPNGFLDRPLEIPVQAPWATFPPLDEISPDLRYKNYLRILKQHRRNQ